jgi:hypothetical protein
VQTSKHRFFVFLDAAVLPDDKLIAIALDDPYFLGVLSSRVHVAWALATGARLGVGNDPVYNKTACFEPFPFPPLPPGGRRALAPRILPGEGIAARAPLPQAPLPQAVPPRPLLLHPPGPAAAAPDPDLAARIRDLAEQIDAHRKRQQALHPGLTVTGMYNVLEKLRVGGPLTEKEREIHGQGLVSVLRELHDALDAAVLAAYGWSDLAAALVGKPGGTAPGQAKAPEQTVAEEALLSRLVALNAERAAEERRGLVRWLRPEYQTRAGAAVPTEAETEATGDGTTAVAPLARQTWPKTLAEQARAVRLALADGVPVTVESLAASFQRAPRERVAELLETLVSLGQAQRLADGRFVGV